MDQFLNVNGGNSRSQEVSEDKTPMVSRKLIEVFKRQGKAAVKKPRKLRTKAIKPLEDTPKRMSDRPTTISKSFETELRIISAKEKAARRRKYGSRKQERIEEAEAKIIQAQNNLVRIETRAMEDRMPQRQPKIVDHAIPQLTPQVCFNNNFQERNFTTTSSKPANRLPLTTPAKTQQQICIITGKTAKYLDPVTGFPFSDVHSFRILRHIYHNNLRELRMSGSPMDAGWWERHGFEVVKRQLAIKSILDNNQDNDIINDAEHAITELEELQIPIEVIVISDDEKEAENIADGIDPKNN